MAAIRVDNQASKARVFENIPSAAKTLEMSKDELRSEIKVGNVAVVHLGGCQFVNTD